MKIGIYGGEWHPGSGGGFTFQHELINEITKANSRHEIFIIGSHNVELPAGRVRHLNLADYRERLLLRLFKKAINILTRTFSGRELFVAGALDRAVQKNCIELVWFISTVVGKVTVPYIVTVWDLAHRIHPYFPEVSVTGWGWDSRENHYRALLPRAACIITGTQAGKEEIIKYYQVPDHLVKVVPFPTPSFVLHPAVSSTANKEVKLPERYLFYPAQFWPHKNHVGLLLAMKILRDKYDMDLKLVLTGADRGNLDYVREKISELKMNDQVMILGFVDKDLMIELYRNAFALVFPTFFGPDNLPPLEAFALGCPVLASEVSGAQEQLGDAAILFDPKNSEDIANKIKILYDDPAQREHIRQKGRIKAEAWTMHDYVNRVLAFADEFETVRRCWSSTRVYVHK